MAVAAPLVLGAAGAAIGGAFFSAGILGVSGAAIGWTIGSAIGSTFGPTQKSSGPRLGDLRVTGTEYGQTIPWVAGSPRIAGQIAWASPRRETATTESSGGKGGGGGSEYTTYTYDMDLLILLTENPIIGVSRIWSNNDMVYNGVARAGVWSDLRIYTGADDQMPDPTYEAAVGVGNAPAYRGRGYVFIQGLQLGNGGAIPNLTFEIGVAGANTESVGWLGQTDEIIGTLTTAQVGNDAIIATNGTGTIIDGTEIYEGFPTLLGRFTVSSEVPVSYDDNIRIEWYQKINSFDNTGEFFDWDGGSGNFRISWSINFSSPKKLAPAISYSTLIGGGGGVWRATSLNQSLFSPANFYHYALQWNGTDKFLDFYIDGFWIARFGDGLTNIYADGFLGCAAGLVSINTTRYAGLVIRPQVATADLYPTNAFDVQNFLPPTARFGLGQPLPVPWYDTTPDPDGLKKAVDALMARAGYESDDWDSSQLAGEPLYAFVIGNTSNTRSSLEALQSAFFFEAAKSDKIYFKPRAATPVATIFYDDLNTKPESGPDGDPFALTVANDLEIPSQIGVTYRNMDADFQNSTEYSERVFVTQDAINSVQLPVGMLPPKAKGVADAMLIDQIASKASAPLALPLDYAALEPSDVVEVQTPDRVYRMRLISRTDAAGILGYEAVVDDANALTSAEITDPSYPNQQGLLQIAETIWLALDVPIFNDGANAPGYYVVAKQDAGDLWPGAVFLRSFDDVGFTQVQQFPSQNTFGDCDTTLGAWAGGYVWDETNTLDVTVNGELSSSTKDAMLNDATINVALVGEDGSWECIRFRNAELLDAGQYRLSGFIRGFRGTEWAMDSHGAGEQFVYVTDAIRRVGTDVSQIGLLRYIKAVTSGFRADSVTSVEFTDTGVALKPFAPVNAVALADGSDIVVTWQRRTRLTTRYGGAAPGQVVPLGEASESYEVQIFNGSTLVRTEVVSSPTYTYLAADWATDGFSSTDTATFIIAQQSLIVGNGYETEVEGIIP